MEPTVRLPADARIPCAAPTSSRTRPCAPRNASTHNYGPAPGRDCPNAKVINRNMQYANARTTRHDAGAHRHRR